MPIDFIGQHRIKIVGHYYPLYGFTVIPLRSRPAGLAPGVEEAMPRLSPAQPLTLFCETVAFGCDYVLSVGEIYDYLSAGNEQRGLKILTADEGNKYRGILQ